MSLLFSQERIMEIHDHRIMTESREEGRMEERNNMVKFLMKRFNFSLEEAQAALEENAEQS